MSQISGKNNIKSGRQDRPENQEISDQGTAQFGWPVGTARDVNGDGYANVIVGAYL